MTICSISEMLCCCMRLLIEVPRKDTATEADPALGFFFALKHCSSYAEQCLAGQYGKPVKRAQIGPV